MKARLFLCVMVINNYVDKTALKDIRELFKLFYSREFIRLIREEEGDGPE